MMAEMINNVSDIGYFIWIIFLLCISNVIARGFGAGGWFSTIVVLCLILNVLEWISGKFKNFVKDNIIDNDINEEVGMLFDVIENIEISSIFEIGEKVVTFAI